MKTKKKNKRSKGTKEKKSFDKKIAIISASLFFIFFIVFFISSGGSDEWTVSDEGILNYPENRGPVDVKVVQVEKGDNYVLEEISFPSKDYTVEALLRVPQSQNKVPGVVILPGATVHKEQTQGLAEILQDMGYASIGIEQRNTGGVDFQQDLELFRQGNEPIEHRMVFDALRAVDVLSQDKRIDEDRIVILGESNGGRFGIIAAAIDTSVSGVIGISTSGYNTEAELSNTRDPTVIMFYRSIDPDTYLELIPPRKLVMVHSVNDSIIPLELAKNTFQKAKEPVQFYEVTTGDHGFSEGMKKPLERELRIMFG